MTAPNLHQIEKSKHLPDKDDDKQMNSSFNGMYIYLMYYTHCENSHSVYVYIYKICIYIYIDTIYIYMYMYIDVSIHITDASHFP